MSHEMEMEDYIRANDAQIASLCDHVDLDGHLLIDDGPYRGLGFVDGVVTVSHGPGIGVEAV